ncbi:MAG TPA: MFS transporter [Acetobacteraceae bacterium]|nr:MFS transporter [Acetobacteraceae bacterium]
MSWSGQSFGRKRLGLVLGINQTLSWGMTFYLPAVVIVPVAHDLGQSTFALLGAFTMSLLIAGFCAPRVGRWIDRNGGKGCIAVSIVVVAAGQAILAVSPNIAVWYLGWGVLGVGMAMGLYDAAFATIGTLLGREAGPTITGVTLLAGFASTVFWSLGSAIIGFTGWRGLMLVYAGLMLCVNLPMVLALVPRLDQNRKAANEAAGERSPVSRMAIACLAGFFTLRWFITSALAAHILALLHGIGLDAAAAVVVASLIGPGQVAGRVLEWTIGRRFHLLIRARLAALLFPIGAALLPLGGPVAATAFAILYGMSNGIMTINRGTLPLALFGPNGYATVLGWLAVPVLVAQAVAPTVAAPVVAALPSLWVFLIGGALGLFATLLLLPLRLPRQD